jgi:O-methyltransferase involved in polyketide biosynthesis
LIWEGVTNYLTADTVDRSLRQIGETAANPSSYHRIDLITATASGACEDAETEEAYSQGGHSMNRNGTDDQKGTSGVN